MLLFGVNFNLFFFLLIGRVRDVLRSEELRTYLIIILASTGIILWNVHSLFDSIGDALRAAFFQVTSIISTTGFITVNYEVWPTLSKMILLCLTVIGAMAGSTAGGLKLSRLILLVKGAVREIKHVLRPRSVSVTRLEGEVVPDETVRATGHYLTVYAAILLAASLLISVDGFTVEETVTAALTCLNNVGPGLGAVGPVGNFAGFSYFSKSVLSLVMLIGRLEIIPVLIFFTPSTWRRA